MARLTGPRNMSKRTDTIDELIRRYLACSACHGALDVVDGEIRCSICRFRGRIADGVAVMKNLAGPTYFDEKHQIMSEAKHDPETWTMFYEQQVQRVRERVFPGSVVLDVGCGPGVPYECAEDVVLIGVDPSYESIRSNATVDIPVYASGDALPIPTGSVDTILCFYSVHHMTGETLVENFTKVSGAFHEFSRVIKPGGNVMIFDLSPWWPGAILGNATWNLARRLMGRKLDMYFWRASALRQLGQSHFRGATLHVETFRNPLFATFPPVFSLPSLKIPRILYPFDINLYRWELPSTVTDPTPN